jgi:hypothetical protein
MSKQLSMNELLLILADLKVDVPVQKYEKDKDGRLVIYLYGGGVKHWPPLGMAVVQEEKPLPNANMAKPPVTRLQLSGKPPAKRKKAT